MKTYEDAVQELSTKAALEKAGQKLVDLTPQKVADAFSAIIREWLTAEELEEVVKRNKVRSHPSVCHSHDFCDANVAMSEAFEKLLGLSDDEVCDLATGETRVSELWNEAW